MTGLEPMGGMIGGALRKLGLERLDVVLALLDEWEELAPDPWRQHARPVLLRGGELLVEALSAPAVSLLRYATGDLLRALDERFGEGVVSVVRVRASRPGSSSPAP